MSRNPLACGSQYTASSKSLASSPSIVTSGRSRRSTRRAASAGIHFGAIRFRFAHRLGRKFLRQVEARDGGFAGELDRLFGIEPLDDARLRRRALTRVTRHGRDDPVAVARAAQFFRRHEAAHADAPVGGGDERGAAVHFERADERLGRMFEDLLEPARIAAIAAALDRHAHAVAVHDTGHLRRRQENGFFLAFDAHEAEAGAVGADDAFGRAAMAGRPGIRRLPAARGLFCGWRGLSWRPRDLSFRRFNEFFHYEEVPRKCAAFD